MKPPWPPPAPAGDVGAELVRDVDLDPADRVDQVFEAGEVDDRDVVDLDPEEVFDRFDLRLAPPKAKAALIFCGLWPGISA